MYPVLGTPSYLVLIVCVCALGVHCGSIYGFILSRFNETLWVVLVASGFAYVATQSTYMSILLFTSEDRHQPHLVLFDTWWWAASFYTFAFASNGVGMYALISTPTTITSLFINGLLICSLLCYMGVWVALGVGVVRILKQRVVVVN